MSRDAAFLIFEAPTGASYGLYIPDEGYPSNVSTLLGSLRLGVVARYNAQAIATAALVALTNENTVRAKPLMLNPLAYEPHLSQVDHYYRVHKVGNSIRVDYTPIERGYMRTTKGHFGSFEQFKNWVLQQTIAANKATTTASQFDNEIVRFYYSGGSTPGFRLVRVTSFDGRNIRGVDLGQGEDAHRTYNMTRIQNGLRGVQVLT